MRLAAVELAPAQTRFRGIVVARAGPKFVMRAVLSLHALASLLPSGPQLSSFCVPCWSPAVVKLEIRQQTEFLAQGQHGVALDQQIEVA